jgi:hypothetical protein
MAIFDDGRRPYALARRHDPRLAQSFLDAAAENVREAASS